MPWTFRKQELTIEEAFHLQIADAEAKHRQLVQSSPDLLGEGQQAGELVQLAVEAVAVAFGWVGLGAIGGRLFGAVVKERKQRSRQTRNISVKDTSENLSWTEKRQEVDKQAEG